jgi:hypothetical protein
LGSGQANSFRLDGAMGDRGTKSKPVQVRIK